MRSKTPRADRSPHGDPARVPRGGRRRTPELLVRQGGRSGGTRGKAATRSTRARRLREVRGRLSAVRRRQQARIGRPSRRLRFAAVVSAVLLVCFVGRLVQLQAVQGREYANAATQNRLQTVALPAVRGTITDRNGMALATTLDTLKVIADPTTVLDPVGTAALLGPLLGKDEDELAAKLAAKPRRYVPLADHVPPEIWRRITSYKLTGLFTEPEPQRYYPGGPVAANILGFVDAQGAGKGGIELALQNTLAGVAGKRTYQQAHDGHAIVTAGYREQAAKPGEGVQLTIDRDLQWMAQQTIAARVKETGAESGTVVVMVPSTGEILALAEAPTFDPNHIAAADREDVGNRALTDIYEPGSTAKVMTVAAALEDRAVKTSTRLMVPGAIVRGGATFHDHIAHGVWRLTPAGVIAKSSNIGAVLISEKMSAQSLHDYFSAFGVGQPTGLGFPGESRGILAPARDWSASQRYTVAFGQGLSVNAVQAASVYATIANGGVRVSPSLVRGYLDRDGRVATRPAAKATRVVSSKTADKLTRMVESVVSEEGTAPMASIPGYRIAGKTGTAERYDARCRGYCGYTASFIGFAPADKPAVVVACTLQNPVSPHTGGRGCGPVFTQVTSFALKTLKVPPTGSKASPVRLTW